MAFCTLSYAQDNKVIKGFSGGMETAFYMFEADKHDWELESKADWLLAINSDGFNMPTGPRLYFGCIFAH